MRKSDAKGTGVIAEDRKSGIQGGRRLLRSPVRPETSLQVVGLFAGIGGIELGLSRAGHQTGLLCDNDPAARAVLAERFGAEVLFTDEAGSGDITRLAELPSNTTLLTAGFPCQDLSQAGRTRGIRGSRSGLVGEVFRLLHDARTPWILIENVPFMLHLAGGEALYVIIAALEDLGYSWAYRVVDSRSFGLPQRRRRVFLLASLGNDPRGVLFADEGGPFAEPSKLDWVDAACGFYWTEGNRGLGWTYDAIPTLKGGSGFGIPSAPAIVMPEGVHGERIGTPTIQDAERLQGFSPDWTAPATSVERASARWRLVGNAVSVGAAEWLGLRLCSPGVYDDSLDKELLRPGGWPTAAYNVGDGPRVPAGISEWPLRVGRPALADFLKYPVKPLSLRASMGFYNRFSQSSLRKPDGFLMLVDRHIKAMRSS